jgi:MtN3 and saliva related transmembrane protein
MTAADWIGWGSSCVLLCTLVRQVFVQWRTRATGGVSRWLFVGQLTASSGFAIYSWLVQNWVFFVSNLALLLVAISGEVIYLHNKKRGKAECT